MESRQGASECSVMRARICRAGGGRGEPAGARKPRRAARRVSTKNIPFIYKKFSGYLLFVRGCVLWLRSRWGLFKSVAVYNLIITASNTTELDHVLNVGRYYLN